MSDSEANKMLESTPNIPPINLGKVKAKNALLQTSEPSPIMPIHSSTLNDSLLASVDLWNLKITPNVTPSTSATTSPAEFYKNHQESLQKTPLKHTSLKLGSPERNGIISGRKPTVAKCGITPKIERSSPAKKRLFGLHNINGGSAGRSPLAAHTKHDPVNFFMKKRNVQLVVEQIFGALNDKDLYNCRRVSRTWREAVDKFPVLKRSAMEFSAKIKAMKENPNKLNVLLNKSERDKSSTVFTCDKFIQLGQTLSENQSLRKCQRCENPQIVEYNIGQCLTCGYICCFKCNSFSHDGPEGFVDKCNSSALDLSKHKKRRTLMDSPPHSQFSFLSSSSYSNQSNQSNADNSHLYANNNTSIDSCYWSYEDVAMKSSLCHTPDTSSPSLRIHNGQRSNKRQLERVPLQFDEHSIKRAARNSNLYTPVVQIRKSPGRNVLEESPEKDFSKYKGAGTTESKKRLRRLLR